jgi:hypothetical protein
MGIDTTTAPTVFESRKLVAAKTMILGLVGLVVVHTGRQAPLMTPQDFTKSTQTHMM